MSHRNLEPVTAMCANNAANTLLTGDAKGYIARWKIEKADNTASDLSLAVKEVCISCEILNTAREYEANECSPCE